jgi:hypothetical protein
VVPTCAELDAGCGFFQVGCNTTLDCGACAMPQTCGGAGVPHQCGCTPKTQAQLCDAAGYVCGALQADDGCGHVSVYDCGSCGSGDVCASGHCCNPPADPQMCAGAGFQCGHTLIIDRCGQSRPVDCGSCGGTNVCSMSDTGSACGPCVSEDDASFCARQGATCGSLSALDNCGAMRTVDCGGCDVGVTCGASAGPNLCACLPLLTPCAASAQCCNGSCGAGGLCCVAQGNSCVDESQCCSGDCIQGVCSPSRDGGIIGNGLGDDGGVL